MTDTGSSGLFINKDRTITQTHLIPNLENTSDGSPAVSPVNLPECSKYAVIHKFEKFYLPLPCNKWTCSPCGKKLAKDLETRLAQSEANDWKIKTHITLTVSGEYESKIIDEALGERRYGCSRGVIPQKPIRIPSGLWEFMSLNSARLAKEYFDKRTSNERRSDIARSISYDSRFDGDIILSIVSGVAL